MQDDEKVKAILIVIGADSMFSNGILKEELIETFRKDLEKYGEIKG
jgi:hypothetical protein